MSAGRRGRATLRALVRGGLLAVALAAAHAAALGAQSPADDPPPLERIEALADAGRAEEARRALRDWFEREGREVDRRRMARARLLRARLTREVEDAEVEYLWVAIDGGPPEAATAWLRLAQLHLAAGEPERARRELERLRAEHPESPEAAESWLWTGRALEASGRLAEACESWRRAAAEAGRLARRAEEEAAAATAALRACGGAAIGYAVQLGAFRSGEAARELGERAAAEGLDARVEREEGLHKVRVGRFASLESARRAAERVRRAGFSAAIVASRSLQTGSG